MFTGLINSLASCIKFSYSGRRSLSALDSQAATPDSASTYLGWLDQPSMNLAISSSLVYLDSFPFGGGHTCFYALSLKRPILMLDTHENRRCSFMMHLVDLLVDFEVRDCDYQEYGIYSKPEQIARLLNLVSERKPEALATLLSIQEKQCSSFFDSRSRLIMKGKSSNQLAASDIFLRPLYLVLCYKFPLLFSLG